LGNASALHLSFPAVSPHSTWECDPAIAGKVRPSMPLGNQIRDASKTHRLRNTLPGWRAGAFSGSRQV